MTTLHIKAFELVLHSQVSRFTDFLIYWVLGFLVDFLAVVFLPTVLLDFTSLVAAGWKSGSSDSAPVRMR